MDVLFVNPGSHKKIYQDLSKDYSAIEPPTWSLLLAQSCRSVGFNVGILDPCAERLTYDDTINRIEKLNPRLICFVVYGQNPNSGTVNMTGTIDLINEIKNREQKLLEESKKNRNDEPPDPLEEYTTQKVKFAQLVWTYNETQKKLDEYRKIIVKTRDIINETETKHSDFKEKYMEKYSTNYGLQEDMKKVKALM